VDQYPEGAGPYGTLNMASNAWEWTTTKWGKPYPYEIEDEWNADYLAVDTIRTVRGGAYWNNQRNVRGAYRNYFNPRYRNYYSFGMRIVLDSNPIPPLGPVLPLEPVPAPFPESFLES
jgi:formylglycine-generating enzyme required for sulfatase activity